MPGGGATEGRMCFWGRREAPAEPEPGSGQEGARGSQQSKARAQERCQAAPEEASRAEQATSAQGLTPGQAPLISKQP